MWKTSVVDQASSRMYISKNYSVLFVSPRFDSSQSYKLVWRLLHCAWHVFELNINIYFLKWDTKISSPSNLWGCTKISLRVSMWLSFVYDTIRYSWIWYENKCDIKVTIYKNLLVAYQSSYKWWSHLHRIWRTQIVDW